MDPNLRTEIDTGNTMKRKKQNTNWIADLFNTLSYQAVQDEMCVLMTPSSDLTSRMEVYLVPTNDFTNYLNQEAINVDELAAQVSDVIAREGYASSDGSLEGFLVALVKYARQHSKTICLKPKKELSGVTSVVMFLLEQGEQAFDLEVCNA